MAQSWGFVEQRPPRWLVAAWAAEVISPSMPSGNQLLPQLGVTQALAKTVAHQRQENNFLPNADLKLGQSIGYR
jgi:hypothetical protein